MDLDIALKRLKELPVDPQLIGMEDAVLAAVNAAADGDAALSRGTVGIAACLALAIGLLGSAIPGGAETSASAAPIATVPALAPSSLLGGSE